MPQTLPATPNVAYRKPGFRARPVPPMPLRPVVSGASRGSSPQGEQSHRLTRTAAGAAARRYAAADLEALHRNFNFSVENEGLDPVEAFAKAQRAHVAEIDAGSSNGQFSTTHGSSLADFMTEGPTQLPGPWLEMIRRNDEVGSTGLLVLASCGHNRVVRSAVTAFAASATAACPRLGVFDRLRWILQVFQTMINPNVPEVYRLHTLSDAELSHRFREVLERTAGEFVQTTPMPDPHNGPECEQRDRDAMILAYRTITTFCPLWCVGPCPGRLVFPPQGRPRRAVALGHVMWRCDDACPVCSSARGTAAAAGCEPGRHKSAQRAPELTATVPLPSGMARLSPALLIWVICWAGGGDGQ